MASITTDPQQQQALNELLNEDNSVPVFIGSALMFLLSTIFFPVKLVLVITSILLFASFDAMVFWKAINRISVKSTMIYRILQVTFQVFLCKMMFDASGSIYPAILFMLGWFFSICDWLFYILLKQWGYKGYEDMSWLWWTAIGIIERLQGKKVTGATLTVFAQVALVGIAIIALL